MIMLFGLVTDQGDLDDFLESMTGTFDRIATYDDYNYTHIDSTGFTEGIRLDSISAILGRCSDMASSQQSIKDARTVSLHSDLADIADALDNITPRATYDGYYKTIHSLFIRKIIEGKLTPTDYDDLNTIAHDAEDSSMANVTAFALFPLCSGDAFPDYASLESEPIPISINSPSKTPQSELPLMPSIVGNSENLYLHLDKNTSGYLSIYDSSGRLAYNQILSYESGMIKINFNIIPGIYYWSISDKDGKKIMQSGFIPVLK